jgi:hypothetical protein
VAQPLAAVAALDDFLVPPPPPESLALHRQLADQLSGPFVARMALPDPVDADIKVIRRDRLGGLLHEYSQVA